MNNPLKLHSMSIDCDYCEDYGIHAPTCPYIEHQLKPSESEGAECGECHQPLIDVFYCNPTDSDWDIRMVRRVCGDCWNGTL